MTMQTARAYLQCQIKKNHVVNNNNVDSSRLFTLLNWKESDVNNDNAHNYALIYDAKIEKNHQT